MADNEIILNQVEKDVDSIVDLESAKAFAEKYDWYAKWYVEKNKIIRDFLAKENNDENNNDDNLSLEDLIKSCQKISEEHLLEATIMTAINDYRITIGLPILK
jgi:hypothetical protein